MVPGGAMAVATMVEVEVVGMVVEVGIAAAVISSNFTSFRHLSPFVRVVVLGLLMPGGMP